VTDPTERLRLFVAVDVPEHHLRVANEAVADLRRRLSVGRWTHTEGQHVTLKFLGWTPRESLEGVHAAVAKVAARVRPSSIALVGVGAFPSPRRARVLWIGLDDPEETLARLAVELDRALEPLGFPPEKRAFTPHLTLARFKVPVRLPAGMPQIALEGRFTPSHVRLYRSRLHPQGARYEPLESFALRTA
jgi:2'-5' RNA ligase